MKTQAQISEILILKIKLKWTLKTNKQKFLNILQVNCYILLSFMEFHQDSPSSVQLHFFA